jgi:hypothetical protein
MQLGGMVKMAVWHGMHACEHVRMADKQMYV